MEACSPSKLALNFSELSRTTTTSNKSPKTRTLTEKHGQRGLMLSQQQSMREFYRRSQNSIRSFRSEPSWTEGYSKFLEDLDGEEFLKDAPIVESRNRVASSKLSKSRRMKKRNMGMMVSIGIERSLLFPLKI